MKNNLGEIWFITALDVDEKNLLRHPTNGEIKVTKFTRTFGYYRGYDNARLAVKENYCNMHECLYNYLVMERIGEGIHALCNKEKWFKWKNRKWTPCKKPAWAKGIINWALG
jgi:hypothetical protein